MIAALVKLLTRSEIIVGNLYKPLSDNNNTANRAFREELESVLRDLDLKNSEAAICGDFNIDILKLTMRRIFAGFFAIQCEHIVFIQKLHFLPVLTIAVAQL